MSHHTSIEPSTAGHPNWKKRRDVSMLTIRRACDRALTARGHPPESLREVITGAFNSFKAQKNLRER